MIKRRLYLQIYFTIIASLLAVVVVIGVLFAALQKDDDFDDQIFGITGRLTWMALPPATAPVEEQKNAINRLGNEFNIDLNLFNANKRRIATYGEPIEPPDEDEHESGWQRHGSGPAWILRLPDNRWLSVNLRRDRRHRRPLVGILIVLLGIALAIGLASYPFVRKLTGRLERLQNGVEQVGEGELSARVEVEGKDEIASLATSFNTATEKIERLVNSNRQLLANASHELRTPLARVRLGVEMLKEKRDAKRQVALENDIAELDQLIDEILLMSRLNTNTKPELSEVIDVLALAAEESNRYDACSVSGDICEVMGNSKLLRRALRNLIDNGFKHGKPPVGIEISAIAAQVVICVSDGGDGIANGERENVFEPFYRAPGKQNVAGYGLGLALVKQIVQAHGGEVSIAVAAAKGSTIEIRLPRLF